MIVHDRTSATLALALDLEPTIRTALEAKIALLTSGEHDLTDIIIVEPGHGKGDVVREAGF